MVLVRERRCRVNKSLAVLSLGLFAARLAAAPPAFAAKSCSPNVVGAKMLASKNVEDTHPEWVGASIGLGWSLVDVRREGEFLSGAPVTTRGGKLKYRVYVLAREWSCE
jgi:hypothetical protein